jgi:thioredoxin reductase (NADPH)
MPSEHDIAFPRLSRAQIDALRPWGRVRPIAPGDVLFQEGDRGFSFYVVLDGAVEIVEQSRGTPRQVTVHEPGEFTGDVDTLSGRASLVTGRATARGEVLELTAAALRQAVDALPEIGETVLKAFLTRRTLLLSDGFEGIKIIGSRFSPDAHRLRDFASRNAIPFTWLDLESDEQAETLLRQFGVPPSATPVVIGREGRYLANPTVAQLAHCAGLEATIDPSELLDLIVVGGGPAGLAAAVYAASEGLDVLVVALPRVDRRARVHGSRTTSVSPWAYPDRNSCATHCFRRRNLVRASPCPAPCSVSGSTPAFASSPSPTVRRSAASPSLSRRVSSIAGSMCRV